ncbi:dipeptide epimerase [Sphingomonas quercus]|uniref:Dipeptide epimerase n=1 Tax=Sphingomonas quercus TaxID=2842451 RepID=A0ABS6BMG8_9SPHN|nr:dipeptide epimerase [Sphingomonas quercus]MBU3079508.1 dipeptide epimerase [Sphingomonas quercus]
MIDETACTLTVERKSLPLANPFRISGHVFTSSDVIEVALSDGRHVGRGEAAGVYYLADGVPQMLAAVESVRDAVERGVDRAGLRALLPAGGARNALDAALWELEAKRSGKPVWQLAGLDAAPRPIVTTFTLGAEAPGLMAERALAFADPQAIKIKLTGDLALDLARVGAVRAARPECWIGVDANQGFAIGELDTLVEGLVALDVKLLEQPLARGREADLDGYACPIPIAADESVLTLDDVAGAVGRFQVINIKLDKCGGLTEGLEMARAARALGLGVMVGNMVGSSLSMAPAFILGQLCDIVDLDGPIFLAEDRVPAIVYDRGTAWCGEDLWGRDSIDAG